MNAADMLAQFRDANPGMAFPERAFHVPARPDPATIALESRLPSRVVLAGGELVEKLAHPTFVPFEYLFRKFPTSAIYNASPEQNGVQVLGSITVPIGMALAIVDYSFDAYRFSGAVAGDTVPIENRRLSTQLGYTYEIDSYRTANINYELDPSPAIANALSPNVNGGMNAAGAEFSGNFPPQIGTAPFSPSSPPTFPSQAAFARARANSAAGPSGVALGLQPQRRERLGALPLPFTEVVKETKTIVFRAVAFRKVPIPLAFFEVDVTGILMPQSELSTLFAGMNPASSQGGTGR